MFFDQGTDEFGFRDRATESEFAWRELPGSQIPPLGFISGKEGVQKADTVDSGVPMPDPSAQYDLEYKTLAGGIAHNYNNLLMGINGYVELMLLDSTFGHHESLLRMKRHIFSGSSRIISFLKYVRRETGHLLGAQYEDAGEDGYPVKAEKHDDAGGFSIESCHRETPRDLACAAESVVGDLTRVMDNIRNIMTLILARMPDPHRHRDAFEKINRLLMHGAEMIVQLHHCTTGLDADLRPVRLDHLVRDAVDTFNVMNRNIAIHLHIDEALPGICVDPCQITQVVQNLCLNAVDAMPGGGELCIHLASGRMCQDRNGGEDVKGVRLTIRDTGLGMEEGIVRNIFKPFFSTHGIKGRGLGLSSVFRIIQAHGGEIGVDSTPGGGTTFRIFLPSSDQAAAEKGEMAVVKPPVQPVHTVIFN